MSFRTGFRSSFRTRILLATLAIASGARAQDFAAAKRRMDVSVSYTAEHANPVGGGNSWLPGGSAEFGIDLWHGLGLAANLTGVHTNSFNSSGLPLSLVSVTFGPKYRFAAPYRLGPKHTSVFVEGLVGSVHGFGGVFPSQATTVSSANSFATNIGGGVDIGLRHHLAVRAIEASWVHMQLPNTANNRQNDLRLAAGIVFRF